MMNLKSTQVLGQCVSNWDEFYATNYGWLYDSFLNSSKNSILAKGLTDRILTQLVLMHPDIVADNDSAACRKMISLMFPYMDISVDKSKDLNAGRLLSLYYNPN